MKDYLRKIRLAIKREYHGRRTGNQSHDFGLKLEMYFVLMNPKYRA